ncbi:MAG TPA: LysM peptidoglycan-binding domain-containing protein, partial [Chloroflexia bacterium]|nr:LysM peptidoglycan-binding domain-containing protein [Chloroflexia bacterium]
SPTPVAPAPWRRYTVRRGENLSSIGAAARVAADALAVANGIPNPSRIDVGQILYLPPPGWQPPWLQPDQQRAAAAPAVPWVHFTVRRGDTLSGIAAAQGVRLDRLRAANHIGLYDFIQPGQVLRIPPASWTSSMPIPSATATPPPAYYGLPAAAATRAGVPAAPAAVRYTVRAGDNLSTIAARYGVTVDAVARANSLSSGNRILTGQVLAIPGARATAGTGAPQLFVPPVAAPARPAAVRYTVRPGDSLSSISLRYGVAVDTLVRTNGLPNSNFIQAGQTLNVPQGSVVGGGGQAPAWVDAGPWPDASVVAPPSIGPESIDRVLASYGSPAQGTGTTFFALGVQYGIDPAYALAFFIHESSAGTRGVARTSRSIGNIRWTPGYASVEGYRGYATWEDGIADWYQLIAGQYVRDWGLRTVGAIVPRYAPAADNNDEPAYIADVLRLVHSWGGGMADTLGGTGLRANLLPHMAHITTVFGHYADGSPHYGIDLDVPAGTAVTAPVGGTVVAVRTGCAVGDSACGAGWGNHVWWRSNATGHYILIAHFSEINPRLTPGTVIGAGTVLGLSGSTGYSSGPHVHLQTNASGPTNEGSYSASWELPYLACGRMDPQIGDSWGLATGCP